MLFMSSQISSRGLQYPKEFVVLGLTHLASPPQSGGLERSRNPRGVGVEMGQGPGEQAGGGRQSCGLRLSEP